MSETHLDWFPMNASRWISRFAHLSPGERGALLSVVLDAWDAPHHGGLPGRIPDNPEIFERVIGKSWRREMAGVRQHFLPDPEHPGQLVCAWLLELYQAQTARHVNRVKAGRAGGRGKRKAGNATEGDAQQNADQQSKAGATPKQSFSNAKATLKQCSSNKEVSGDPPKGGPPRDPPDGAAVGRGGATAAPPAPDAHRDGPESQRPLVELPGRGRDNAPAPERASDLAAAERLARESPDFAAAVQQRLDEQLAPLPPDERAFATLGYRPAALLELYGKARSNLGAVA